MINKDIDRLIAAARQQRLEELAARLLSGLDRSRDSINKLRWELEEDITESLYVALDLMGWSREMLVADFAEIRSELDFLLAKFEELEEYEACIAVGETQAWLEAKCGFFLERIDAGESAVDLIGL